jgi:hypothetical protein
MGRVTGTVTDSAGSIAETGVDYTISGGSSLPLMATISGDTFTRAVGVREFPQDDTEPDGQHAAALAWTKDLGVRYVSLLLTPNISDEVLTQIEAFAAAGVRFTVTVGQPFTTYTAAQWTKLEALCARLAPWVDMFNGQNEVNHVRGNAFPLPTDWDEHAAVHMRRLFPIVQRVNLAAGTACLVGTPSLWSGTLAQHEADLARLAPLVAPWSNAINWHLYPRGVDPSFQLDETFAMYAAAYGALPVFCTELGYFTAVNYPSTGGAVPVTLRGQRIYLAKAWLEYARMGGRCSIFQMWDSVDPTQTSREASLGIVAVTSVDPAGWSWKPAALDLQTMLHAYRGGQANTVPCEIVGDVQHLAVSHNGGVTLLLWRRVDVEKNRQPITVATAVVTVRTPTLIQTVAVGAEVVVVPIG